MSILMTNEDIALIRTIKKRTDAVSMTEVIRRSLSLYDIASALAKRGGKLLMQEQDGKTSAITILA